MAEPQHITTRPDSRRARAIGLALGALLALSACSSASEQASVPTVELEPVTTTVAPTTTTTEPTTTTEDPNVAYERDVAEITEVYEASVNYLIDFGVAVDLDALSSFAADPLLDRKIRNTTSWIDQGFVIGMAAYDIQPIETTVTGDSATMLSCNLDGVEVLSSDGQVVIPADQNRFLRTASFRLSPEGWKIVDTGYANEEATECDA